VIIFLDFDGVLHPNAVFMPPKKPLELRAPGELFMHANVLIEALAPYPQAKIILSTSWVRMLGYERTLKKMPPALAARVTGATWHKSMKDGNDDFFHSVSSRYHQVMLHVNKHNVQHWIAIDDLFSGGEANQWEDEHWDHLVLTKQELGLGCKKTQQELKIKLDVLGKYGI